MLKKASRESEGNAENKRCQYLLFRFVCCIKCQQGCRCLSFCVTVLFFCQAFVGFLDKYHFLTLSLSEASRPFYNNPQHPCFLRRVGLNTTSKMTKNGNRFHDYCTFTVHSYYCVAINLYKTII